MGPSGSAKKPRVLEADRGLDSPTSGQVIWTRRYSDSAKTEGAGARPPRSASVSVLSPDPTNSLQKRTCLMPMELAGRDDAVVSGPRVLDRVRSRRELDHYPVAAFRRRASAGRLRAGVRAAPADDLWRMSRRQSARHATGQVYGTHARVNRDRADTMVMVTQEPSLAESADEGVMRSGWCDVSEYGPKTAGGSLRYGGSSRAYGSPWREMGLRGRSYVRAVLAVAIGGGGAVGSPLTGCARLQRSFRHMRLAEARTMMAGDMTIRGFALTESAEKEAVSRTCGARRAGTWITETDTMDGGRPPRSRLLIR